MTDSTQVKRNLLDIHAGLVLLKQDKTHALNYQAQRQFIQRNLLNKDAIHYRGSKRKPLPDHGTHMTSKGSRRKQLTSSA